MKFASTLYISVLHRKCNIEMCILISLVYVVCYEHLYSSSSIDILHFIKVAQDYNVCVLRKIHLQIACISLLTQVKQYYLYLH